MHRPQPSYSVHLRQGRYTKQADRGRCDAAALHSPLASPSSRERRNIAGLVRRRLSERTRMTGPGYGKTARWLAFALALAVSVLIAFVLMRLDDQLSIRQQLSAIGLNLMASVVFAIIFAILSTRLQERVLQETSDERFKQFSAQVTQELRSRFDNLSAQLTEQLAIANTQYFPAKTYQPAEEAREDFNRDVSASLQATGIYVFRGTSAKYVAARVRAAKRPLQELRVITLDPGPERVLRTSRGRPQQVDFVEQRKIRGGPRQRDPGRDPHVNGGLVRLSQDLLDRGDLCGGNRRDAR
jgi:hypothetical protein